MWRGGGRNCYQWWTTLQAEAVGGTTYFLPKNHQVEHMPDHTYYRAPPSHVAQERGTQVQSLYPNPELAKDLSQKSLLSHAQLPQDDASGLGVAWAGQGGTIITLWY